MPTYCYECPRCGGTTERTAPMKEAGKRVYCLRCTSVMQRDFRAERINIQTDPDITSHEIEQNIADRHEQKHVRNRVLAQSLNRVPGVRKIVGKDGKRQWASHASASSTYADRTGQPGAFGRTGYRTDVKISPSGIPHQYVVEFKISQTLQNGTSNLINSPRMIVTAGQEGEVKAMDLQERDGILCKALIEEKVDSVEALTSVTVKMQGIETLSSTQHMTVTK